jgi:hypothetical protein
MGGGDLADSAYLRCTPFFGQKLLRGCRVPIPLETITKRTPYPTHTRVCLYILRTSIKNKEKEEEEELLNLFASKSS